MKFRNTSPDRPAALGSATGEARIDALPHYSAALSIVNGAALQHANSGALSNARMKVVEEVRRERLALLKEKYGSFPAINKLLGRSATDSTLSQIANQSIGSKTDKPKTMGSPQARQIEEALKLERGWMDTDPDLIDRMAAQLHSQSSSATEPASSQLEALTAPRGGADLEHAVATVARALGSVGERTQDAFVSMLLLLATPQKTGGITARQAAELLSPYLSQSATTKAPGPSGTRRTIQIENRRKGTQKDGTGNQDEERAGQPGADRGTRGATGKG